MAARTRRDAGSGESAANPSTQSEQAAHYREYAAQIEELASGEPNARLRERLIALARRYAVLAERLANPSN